MGSKRRHNIHSWNVAHIGAQCGMFEGQGFKMLQKATLEEINAQERPFNRVFFGVLCCFNGFSMVFYGVSTVFQWFLNGFSLVSMVFTGVQAAF